MAQSSKFARIDEDILVEFIYHDQNVANVDNAKIENDDNGSQLKYLNLVDGDDSADRFLIHELGSDVVNFDVKIGNGFVYINNFASRELILKNGNTYKFNLSDSSIDNINGFQIQGGTTQLTGTVLTFTPNTNGTYSYTYQNLAGDSSAGGSISVGNKANSLYATPTQETGNSIKTAPGESGRYYAVPTEDDNVFALLDNSLNYLDSAEWQGTSSANLQIVDVNDVQHVYYDTVRLHLRTGYSFSGRGLEGFMFQVKARRENNSMGYFTSLVYKNSSSFEIQNPKPFVLGDSSFSKYVEIKVPSLVHMKDPAKNEDFANTFFSGSNTVTGVNYEICLNLINQIKTVNGYEYIEISDEKKLILSQEDEMSDISIQLEEANDGDYFNIYGLKDGSQAGFENYINGRIKESGDDIVVFYDIDVSEQLGLNYISMYQTTLVQTTDFDQALIYRPVIKNSAFCSSFLIKVAMRIYNETDNTQILKIASIIHTNPKKYGKRMQKISLKSKDSSNIVYNLLPNSSANTSLNGFVNSIRPSVGETKYVPIAIDTVGIIAGSTNITLQGADVESTNEIEYFKEGEALIKFSKVSDNFIKFSIVKKKGDSLESISLLNAQDIIMTIKSGRVEQQVHHLASFPDIDSGKGEVMFKITKAIAARFNTNTEGTNFEQNRFYITLKNGETESLLYYGKMDVI